MQAYEDIKNYFANPAILEGVHKANRGNLTVDQLVQQALTAIKANKRMWGCTLESYYASVLKAARLGLEIGPHYGQSFLKPKKDQCELWVGYKGLIVIAKRANDITHVEAQVVYANDAFEHEYGLKPVLSHRPTMSDKGDVVGAYAIVHVKDAANPVFRFIDMAEIKKRMGMSEGLRSDYSPWKRHFEAMACKCAIAATLTYIGVSGDLADEVTETLMDGIVIPQKSRTEEVVDEIKTKNKEK